MQNIDITERALCTQQSVYLLVVIAMNIFWVYFLDKIFKSYLLLWLFLKYCKTFSPFDYIRNMVNPYKRISGSFHMNLIQVNQGTLSGIPRAQISILHLKLVRLCKSTLETWHEDRIHSHCGFAASPQSDLSQPGRQDAMFPSLNAAVKINYRPSQADPL